MHGDDDDGDNEDGDDEDGDIYRELGSIKGETAKVNGELATPHGQPLQVGHLNTFEFEFLRGSFVENFHKPLHHQDTWP